MEVLQRLTRRQVDALSVIGDRETAERGVPLKVVAAVMHLTPPSALGHLSPLEGLGLVVRYRGKTRLSAAGRKTLLEYRRHHRIAESLFSRLGLPPRDVCHAAREVDLAISHRTVEQVCVAEDHPTVCPHGEPIPPCGEEN